MTYIVEEHYGVTGEASYTDITYYKLHFLYLKRIRIILISDDLNNPRAPLSIMTELIVTE